jgi:hypothetical protein
MTAREQYAPGPANPARVEKDGENWTLVLAKQLRHPPENVWRAITDPKQLWHNIDRRYISMGAAGWQICFDVLDHALSSTPVGRIVGPQTIKFDGWRRLNAEYAEQFDTAGGEDEEIQH